jgi:group I intron endonuclease
MKFFYNKQANSAGIYKIINTQTNRFYIGQAGNFKKRWHEHKKSLLTNKKQNRFLLNDFNKCKKKLGHHDFIEFHVLEVMTGSTRAERNIREECYIKEYYDNQAQCYNFKQKSDSLPRSVFSNDPNITKKILSEKSKAMWSDPKTRKKILKRKNAVQQTDEYKQACSEAQKKNWQDEERREKTSERMKKEHASGSRKNAVEVLKESQPRGRKTFKERMRTDPEFKKKYQESGKKKVAKVNERYKADTEFRKKMDAHSRKNIIEFNKNRELTKKPAFVSPAGKVYDNVYNLAGFAREHNLDPSCAYKLVNGKLKKHRGWKLA